MKGYKLFSIALAVLVFAFLLLGAQVSLRGAGEVSSIATNTYANSQTDTVTYNFEGKETDLVFWARFRDSVKVTNAIIVRYFDGKPAVHVGSTDTLWASTGFTATTADTTIFKALTEAPQPEQYKFIIRYTASGNGVTTPTVKYGVVKVYSK